MDKSVGLNAMNNNTANSTQSKMINIARLSRLIIMISLMAASNLSAKGQTFRGGISGTTTDNTGAAVAGASIKTTSISTSALRTVTTGVNGEFTIADLTPGFYNIEVSQLSAILLKSLFRSLNFPYPS